MRIAATPQALLGLAFVLMGTLAGLYGPAAQAAGEQEIIRQGFTPTLLAEKGVHFDEPPALVVVPILISLLLGVIALLNLRRTLTGRVLTYVAQPVLLVLGAIVMSGQVFATQFLASTFAGTGADVPALVDAATDAFPVWLRPLVYVRFLLATAGSVLVLVLVIRAARPSKIASSPNSNV